MLTISVTGIQAKITTREPLVSGTVGKEIKFVFDSTWASYSKMAIYRYEDPVRYQNSKKAVVTLPGSLTTQESEIPADVLPDAGILNIGIAGVEDSTYRKTTVWVQVPVLQGAIWNEETMETTLAEQVYEIAAKAPPYIGTNGHWWRFDVDTFTYVDTGTSASGTPSWETITNKPSTFPPSEHTHDDRYYTETEIDARLDPVEEVIPSQATASNQLADKSFVNSSIATNTANYISNNGQPFTSLAELEAYTGTVTNNDYAFVTGTDASGNPYYDRYKATVSGSTVTWALEYRLNNSSFTAAQWAAISSGITAALVAKIDDIDDKEDTDNKVTAMSSASTDTQYPSAKCVYEAVQAAAQSAGVYVATYDVTTYAQILTAFNAGKRIVLNSTSAKTNIPLSVVAKDGTTVLFFEFDFFFGGEEYIFTCASTGWSTTVYWLETTDNKVTAVSSASTDTQYPSAKCVYDELADKEDTDNKVTSLSASSTDTQYPSAKCVYDLIGNVAALLEGLL